MQKLLILFIFFTFSAQAQWTNQANINTPIYDTVANIMVPKIAATPSGDYFFSWYGGDLDSNLDMNLTYFSADGVELWQNGHMVVSSHAQNTWVDDYSMITDSEGNAIIVFSDMRNGNKDVVAYKIDINGNQLWGDNGVVLAVDSSDEYQPKVVLTENDAVYITFHTEFWNGNNNEIIVHKIDASGNLLFGPTGKVFSSAAGSWAYPQINYNNDGGFTIGFFEETGFYPALVRKIMAIRCDQNGNALWNNAAIVNDAAGIASWDLIQFYSEHDGGAYFVWHDDRYNDWNPEVYTQYIDPSGNAMWTQNGVLIGTPTTGQQLYEFISGRNSNGELIILWNTTNSNQSQAKLSLQRVGSTGNILEGPTGKTIIPMANNLQNGERAFQVGDTTFYIYNQIIPPSPYITSLNMLSLDISGNQIWNTAFATSTNAKMHLDLSKFNPSQAVVCWTDEDTLYNHKIMAQNIFLDGTMGPNTTSIEKPNLTKENIHFVTYSSVDNTLILKDLNNREILEIYNMQGQLVYSKNAKNSQNLGHLNKGMYISVIIKDGIRIETFKLMI